MSIQSARRSAAHSNAAGHAIPLQKTTLFKVVSAIGLNVRDLAFLLHETLRNNASKWAMKARRLPARPLIGTTELVPHEGGGLYTVKHTYSEPNGKTGTGAPLTGMQLVKILPSLAEVIERKKGLVLIKSAGAPSALEQMQHYMNQVRCTALNANDNRCFITGLKKTESQNAANSGTSWTLQVEDEWLGMTIEVPVTEIEVNSLHTEKNNDRTFEAIGNAMTKHLGRVHAAWRDAPVFPAVLCPENPRMAQLVSLQEEMLSQRTRGTDHLQTRDEWVKKSEEMLPLFAAKAPRLRRQESANLGAFFVAQNIDKLPPNPMLRSISAPAILDTAGEIDTRGLKRHLLQSNTKQPVHIATTPVPLRPTNQFYKEPSVRMQCSTQATNAFFQTHQVTSEDMAAYHLEHQLDMLQKVGADLPSLKGMAHPRIVRAIQNKQPVRISKQEFVGAFPNETCMVYDGSLDKAWRSLVEEAYPNGNWQVQGRSPSNIQEIEITPSMWLSSLRGVDFDCLEQVINQELAKTDPNKGYPGNIKNHRFIENDPKLSNSIQQAAQVKAREGLPFPVVVRTGFLGGDGHYFTIMPDQHGNWYNLDSLGTTQTGQQACSLFALEGQLHEKLAAKGVTHLLVGPHDA